MQTLALSDRDFKIIIVNIFKIQEQYVEFYRDLECIKKQTNGNSVPNIKYRIADSFNIRINIAQRRISEPENRPVVSRLIHRDEINDRLYRKYKNIWNIVTFNI